MMIPRDPAPALSVPLLSGEHFTLAEARPEGFSIVIFYRGKHCPICRQYLQDVQGKLDDAAAQGIEVTAVSMDGEER
ncbi:MAG: redoxin domain-containing protein, partial [Pseudomonadota bacterium]